MPNNVLLLLTSLKKGQKPVAILELKKWEVLRGQEKVGGNKYPSCVVIFRCFDD